MAISELQNPFEIKPPEELSAELICKLFVKDFTEHNALIGNYHTFLYGSRGSGKSMHFKYLEPRCQAIEYKGLKTFFESEAPFIGIYINCNKGDFTKTDFTNLLDDKELSSHFVNKIITHYFIMDIAECVLKTYIEQLSQVLDPEKEKVIVDKMAGWVDLNKFPEKSLVYLKTVFHNEKKKINKAIDEYFANSGINNNRLRPDVKVFVDVSLLESSFLEVLLQSLRCVLLEKNDIPYYLLFDEANELLEIQKKIINTLISQRKHTLLSVKVSCQPLMYNVFQDLNDRPIQETHDYYLMELDSLYTTDKQSYYNRVKEVAEKRLQIAGCKETSITKLIPESPTDADKKKEAEEFTIKEYDALPVEKRPASKSDYIKKYAMARFFQHTLKKTSYGYTGFENLVHFSSGIIRSFLEPCYTMMEEYKKCNPGTTIAAIEQLPSDIQRRIIEDYSNSFVTTEIINPLKLEPVNSEKRQILESLNNLLNSIGSIFSMRLKDEKSREPRIISFAIKEAKRDMLLQKTLDYGVQKAFFHQKWYRSKSGHEMLECFILNRRLCPRYHLDLSSFQGRIELSQDDLLIAIKNPDAFTKKFEKEQQVEEKQLQLFDF